MTFTILHGKNLDILPTLADNSVDSIVTDPPYELNFMGKKWDSSGIAYSVELWTECLRVLKPGGHLLSFGGSRTYHRVAVAIEDAGFELRDSIAWLYGSGFPKSLDVSKAIDKAAGAERVMKVNERWAEKYPNGPGGNLSGNGRSEHFGQAKRITGNPILTSDPVSPEAQQWNGWGTALKPAHEPIIVARKPLEGTVANNVLTHGTGALNIDGSRIGTEQRSYQGGSRLMEERPWNKEQTDKPNFEVTGRWPANIILDEHTAGLLDEQSDASRFFYVAKASKLDRNEGLDGLATRRASALGYDIGLGEAGEGMFKDRNPQKQNFHPTVKPTALMEYLVKLVTPPNGTVLDPFTGSGSTGKAAILNGFDFIGIEMTEDYLPIIKARLKHAEATYGSQIRMD